MTSNIIWIINFDDKRRKKNLWYSNVNWNLIIEYNKNTKSHKIIYNTWFKINKIFFKNTKIYLSDYNDNNYILDWY